MLSLALTGSAAMRAPGQGADSALVHLSLAVIFDASAFAQDTVSARQVGGVPGIGQLRTSRLILSGLVAGKPGWRYLFSIDYNGLLPSPAHTFSIRDLAVLVPVGRGMELAVGRQKEGLTEQMMTGGRTLSLAERPAPITAFIPTRDNGVRLIGGDARRGRWSIAYFNPETFTAGATAPGGSEFAARAFLAPTDVGDGRRLLQVGGSARWKGAGGGKLRFRTLPESNEAPDFPDTRSFDATGATTSALDVIAQRGAVSLITEALLTDAARRDSTTLRFAGYYVEAAWRPGGEFRSYEATNGALGRVRLRDGRPAWELGARFSRVDLSSSDIDGGVFDRGSVVVSWRTSRSLLLEVEYGNGTLERSGSIGHTRFMTTRVQWERL